jgi:hypothetical protein
MVFIRLKETDLVTLRLTKKETKNLGLFILEDWENTKFFVKFS